jgi:hypothetical protein
VNGIWSNASLARKLTVWQSKADESEELLR